MMNDDFKRMLKDLQEKINVEEEKTYSLTVIEEYRNPAGFGVLEFPDAIGKVTGPCNDSMKITLKVEQGIIRDARFWTDGCGATIACGSMLMKMVEGRSIEEAVHISKDDVLKNLDGLPKDHMHCAKLAVNTFYAALKNGIHEDKSLD